MALALIVGILLAGGTFMILRRGMMRVVSWFNDSISFSLAKCIFPSSSRSSFGPFRSTAW